MTPILIKQCPHCGNDDLSMIEWIVSFEYLKPAVTRYLCLCCSKEWDVKEPKENVEFS